MSLIDIDRVKEKLSTSLKKADVESLTSLLTELQNLYISSVELMNRLARTLTEDNEIIEQLSEGLAKFTIRKAKGETLPERYEEWINLAAPNLRHMQLVKMGDERNLQQHSVGVEGLAEAIETLTRYINKIDKSKAIE